MGVYNQNRRDVPFATWSVPTVCYNPKKGERDGRKDGRKDGKYLSALQFL